MDVFYCAIFSADVMVLTRLIILSCGLDTRCFLEVSGRRPSDLSAAWVCCSWALSECYWP